MKYTLPLLRCLFCSLRAVLCAGGIFIGLPVYKAHSQVYINDAVWLSGPGDTLFAGKGQDITITSAASLYTGGGSVVQARGAVQNNGIVSSAAGGKWILDGAASQHISGTAVFNTSVTVWQNSNPAGITLGNRWLVADMAHFSQGIVHSNLSGGASHLVFQHYAANAGASVSSYTEGFVTRQGTDPFVFPLGDNGAYHPLTAMPDIVANPPSAIPYSVRFINGNPADAIPEVGGPFLLTEKTADIAQVYDQRYWCVNGNLVGQNAFILHTGNITPFINDINDPTLIMVGWNKNTHRWERLGQRAAITGTLLNSDVYEDSIDLSLYSAFTIGQSKKGIRVAARVYLQGAWNAGTANMRDNLRSASLLPLINPYSQMGLANSRFTRVGIEQDEQITAEQGAVIFGSHAENSVVDWVLLEIRNAAALGQVLSTRAALIQRDGDIVDLDGVSPVFFSDLEPGDFYVSVKHRNHLGVMTGTAVTLDENPLAVIDFTTMPNGTVVGSGTAGRSWGNNAQAEVTAGVFALFGGNANANSNIRYIGPQTDQGALLNGCLSGDATALLNNIYSLCDINMNGNVRYIGPINDQAFLLNTVLGSLGNLIIVEQIPN